MSASVLYLGLYGWTSDGRPMLRVNEKASTPVVGASVFPGLVYKSAFTSRSLKCANLTYGGVAKSLCEGEVLKLP